MKKFTTTVYFLLLFAAAGFCQTTYYWVGGTGPASFTALTNWNKNLDGSGDFRSVLGALPNDILIFDGTNVGGTIPAVTGPVTVTMTTNNIGQLKLQNNATVFMQRPTAGGGTGTFTINGDITDAPDLEVEAGSSLSLNSPSADGSVVVILGASATGSISGTVSISNSGSHRFSSPVAGALVFNSGAVFNSGGTSTTYPFGSSSQGVNLGVVFQSGSSLVVTSARSPMGGTSTHQSCSMMPGSNFYLRGAIVASSASGSWANLKTYGNMFIQSGATFTSDGPFYKIDSLTIESGCKLTTHTSGNTPILGNLTVNGTLDAPGGSTNLVIMGGSSPQTISGSGSIVVPSFTVANHSDVSLSKSIAVGTTCNIVGKLNFGTSQITGAATFTSRVSQTPVTFVGNTTTGSFQLTGVSSPAGVTGLYITGPGIAAATNVVGFSSSNSVINLSKPAVSNNTGGNYTFSSDSATLVTSNANGFDTTAGSVVVTGSKSFQTGTNYIINAATASPFGISSTASYYLGLGNVTINAPITTNYNARITGVLNLASGKLTIRPLDSLRILYGTDIAGAPFSSSKYVVSGLSGANAGVLRIDNFSTSKIFPVGSATSYLPVTLTPTSVMNYAVSAFEGVTYDGTPTGAAVSAGQKASIVDAVWTINRTGGTGDCAVSLGWPATLEGGSFSALAGSMVGIGRHNGTEWESPTGSGDNVANTATAAFGSFSPFHVGQIGSALPIQFKTISATIKAGVVEINWTVSNEEPGAVYTIEKSSNGTSFVPAGTVKSNGSGSYVFADAPAIISKIFYRIKVVGTNGVVKYSSIMLLQESGLNSISIYPNPVINSLNISGMKNKTSLRIINANGQPVWQQKTDAGSLSIDVSAYTTGFYLLEIIGENEKKVTRSFIKN